MLQRAASNAYSWWWASHIRTKQSKWMEQNLLDMEEKVQNVLKLITEDGDSFAKRAEMYYKKRPELISYVEESYRAYRALAERYDKISTELQNANNTIASVFPEQVQFAMEDDDDDDNGLPIMPKKLPNASKMSIPRVPKGPMKDFKSEVATAKGANKLLPKKTGSAKGAAPKAVPKSGLSKTEALEEIDKLQKHILSLQTEKEFVKSSYENGLTKYWEIEEKIKEIQEKIICLQEEFGKGMTIEDAEARSLMAAAAIKSCQEKLTQLQEKQERSAKEAGLEHERIKEAREKLASLRDEFDCNQINEESSYRKHESAKTGKYFSLQQEAAGNSTIKEKHELELLREKIKEQFDTGSDTPLTVTEMVEKIDGLVNKVICLETTVSSQNALVKILKTETEELQVQIQTLVNDKASLIDDKNTLRNKLKEMEEKFHEIQDLSESFKNQNDSLQTYFTEAHGNLDNLSEKLQNVKPDEEELEDIVSTGKENRMNLDHSAKLQDIILLHKDVESHSTSMLERQERDSIPVANKELVDIVMELKEWAQGTEDEPDWQKLYLNGMGDKEKTLIDEYTATLRNYKDVKKKLSEVEKENQDSHCETSILIKELENTIAKKDEEIKSLRMKLGLLQQALEECEESNDVKDLDSEQTSTSLRAESTNKSTDEGREDVKVNLIEPTCTMSTVEEKFRMDIDELLEENLNFWMKFSSSFQSLQRFETEIQDLQKEISMVEKNKKTQEGSTTLKHLLKSDVRPLYQHLREIQTELSVWLKMSMSLKDELQCRFTSLCNFQDEIIKALKESAEDDDFKFTSYQAAKFQGEVLNMKQENNKVESELEAGIDHATTLQNNVEKTLNNLNEEYGISGSKKNNDPKFLHSNTANRHSVPLRSFIFGVKPKKQKSIFSCMTPTTHRKFHARSGQL